MDGFLEQDMGFNGAFLQGGLSSYEEASYKTQNVELIKVYRTPSNEKFLDAETLSTLLGGITMNDYVGSDGSRYSASDEVVINKGLDNGLKKVGEHSTSNLSSFPYDYILGLYRVTDMQLAKLIKRYEEKNEVKLKTQYIDIDYKNTNHEKSDNYKELVNEDHNELEKDFTLKQDKKLEEDDNTSELDEMFIDKKDNDESNNYGNSKIKK